MLANVSSTFIDFDYGRDVNMSDDVNATWDVVSGEVMEKRDPLYVVVPLTCVYVVILVTGLVGNVSTCVVIARNKHMHTPTNYYLFSLAMSDLLLLVLGLPPEMYNNWSRYPYVFGEFFCRLTGFAQETSANATVLTITAFTVERYVAICHPFLTYTVSKLSRAVKYILAIWILAIVLAVPQAVQFGVKPFRHANGSAMHGTEQCTLKYEVFLHFEHSFYVSTFLFFVVPMTLILILYMLIGLKLRHSRLLKRPCDRAANRSQNHVIKMLVAVVVAFFICWAPFHCQRVLAAYGQYTERPSRALVVIYNALTYVSGVLYFLSTTINPLLYNTMSNKFRQAFKNTFSDLCSPGHKSGYQTRDYSVLLRGGMQSSTVKETALQRFGPSVDLRLAATEAAPNPAKRLRLLPRVETISNTSLQDVGDQEVTGLELARYMGELNRR